MDELKKYALQTYEINEKWVPTLELLCSNPRLLDWFSKRVLMENKQDPFNLPKSQFDALKIIYDYFHLLDDMELMSAIPDAVEIVKDMILEYQDITFEETDLSWLSEKDKPQLFWAWTYLHLNPINEDNYRPLDPIKKECAYTFEEIYPLLIQKFNSIQTSKNIKLEYIKSMKSNYHLFLTSKPDIAWLSKKAKDDCIWVWRYLLKIVIRMDFLKPTSTEDLFHSIIAIIANWDLLYVNANKLNKGFISDFDGFVSCPQDKTPTKKELIFKLTNAHKQKEIRAKSQSLNLLSKMNHKLLLKYMEERGLSEKSALNEILKAELEAKKPL